MTTKEKLCYSDTTKNIEARTIRGNFVTLDKIRSNENSGVEVHDMDNDIWFSIFFLETMEIVEINDYIDWKE